MARQLEREWEAALSERAHLGDEYERYQRGRPARLTPAELAAIRALAGDIPALWAAPTTTVADRKRLLRAVIESVQVTADGATERVHAAITWAWRRADRRRPEAPGGPDRPAVVLPGADRADHGTGRTGPGQRRDRRPAGSGRLPHPSPARTLPRRRDPAPYPPLRACDPAWTTTTVPITAASGPVSGGWPAWPAKSRCRPRPCSDGSNAAGSPAGKTPGRPAGGSSPQTPPKSSASARCTSCQPATTTGAAGPTAPQSTTPRRTRSPAIMKEKTYAARTEANQSPPGSARARMAGAGTRSASPGRRPARPSPR